MTSADCLSFTVSWPITAAFLPRSPQRAMATRGAIERRKISFFAPQQIAVGEAALFRDNNPKREFEMSGNGVTALPGQAPQNGWAAILLVMAGLWLGLLLGVS